ncbi:MAG: hypothetical protein ACD_28C00181G0005 [uncultured bacterium]|nr:MAG: hypothetical protein ACD_28C00181G0005 [uncultured bacterium]KKT75634.1 MAG: hypothetical protein UW70_C0032G0009 [Candidatus Peregrinibacteria bacterium GW2011_GWA2_44_7]
MIPQEIARENETAEGNKNGESTQEKLNIAQAAQRAKDFLLALKPDLKLDESGFMVIEKREQEGQHKMIVFAQNAGDYQIRITTDFSITGSYSIPEKEQKKPSSDTICWLTLTGIVYFSINEKDQRFNTFLYDDYDITHSTILVRDRDGGEILYMPHGERTFKNTQKK